MLLVLGILLGLFDTQGVPGSISRALVLSKFARILAAGVFTRSIRASAQMSPNLILYVFLPVTQLDAQRTVLNLSFVL